MPAHTPGPWTVDKHDPLKDYVWVSEKKYAIAKVVDVRLPGTGWSNEEGDMLANARLIAAAPRMLEWLKTVTELPGFELNEPYGIEARAILRDVEGVPETGREYAIRIKEHDDAQDQRWTSGETNG